MLPGPIHIGTSEYPIDMATGPDCAVLQLVPCGQVPLLPADSNTSAVVSGAFTGDNGMSEDDLDMYMSAIGLDTSGIGLDTSGIGLDTSAIGLDTSGIGLDTSGIGLDTFASGLDTSGIGLVTVDIESISDIIPSPTDQMGRIRPRRVRIGKTVSTASSNVGDEIAPGPVRKYRGRSKKKSVEEPQRLPATVPGIVVTLDLRWESFCKKMVQSGSKVSPDCISLYQKLRTILLTSN